MEDVQLPYGMEVGTQRLVHVSAVPSGLSDLVCPKCLDRLIAARGPILAHHFRHYGERGDCQGALEHVLHLAAKQIICDEQRILLPAIHARSGATSRMETAPAWHSLHSPQKEARRPGYVPDVLAVMPDNRLINIEIRYRHAVDAEKITKIQADDIHAVEIIITGFTGLVSDTAFRNFVLASAPRIWLHNPDQAQLNARLAAELLHRALLRQQQLEQAEAERQRLWDLGAAERDRIATIAASDYACLQANILLDSQAQTRHATAASIVSAIRHDAHLAEIAASHAIDGAQRALALAEAQAQRIATQQQAVQAAHEQHLARIVARELDRKAVLDSIVRWAAGYYPKRQPPPLPWPSLVMSNQEVAEIFTRLPHRDAQLALMDQSWWREHVPADLAKATWDRLDYCN